jgi:serine/threonine protein kinase
VALHFLPQRDGRHGAEAARSVKMAQGLRHLNLIRIERAWLAGGYLVTAMDLADGSLADLLDVYQEKDAAIPLLELLPLMAQAAAALDFLNTSQHQIEGRTVAVQHGNVCPSNLLLIGPALKLSDFKLAVTLSGSLRPCHRPGRLAYAAPEVFQGQRSYRTDQYALAVTYCELRGGKLPFADTPPKITPSYTRPVPDLSMIPEVERPVIARALAVAPQQRWPSCQDFIAELRKAIQTAGSTEAVYRGPERRREKRYRPDAGVSCRVLTGISGGTGEVRVRDISTRGIGLEVYGLGGAVEPGQTLSLSLTNKRHGFGRIVWLRVMHSSERKDGARVLGGAFVLHLNPEELEALREGGSALPGDRPPN